MTAVAASRRAAPPGAAPAACRGCRHFVSAPGAIEAGLPGLRALGSGYGAVRSGDGLCRLHGRYLAAASRCAAYAAAGADRPAPLDRLVMER
jgi:hypothetical protein